MGRLLQAKAAAWLTSSENWKKREKYKMQNQNKTKMAAARSSDGYLSLWLINQLEILDLEVWGHFTPTLFYNSKL